ncbi:hypothetical protein [Streptomyces sp. CA-179760]
MARLRDKSRDSRTHILVTGGAESTASAALRPPGARAGLPTCR